MNASVALTRDNDFRVASESVNGTAIKFAYDADGLTTCASPTTCVSPGTDALAITWDAVSPRVTNVALGSTNEIRRYNDYGELAAIQATLGGVALYSETLDAPTQERDPLGRVVTRTETTASGSDVWKYTYDPTGRLSLVELNDELDERLTYDANGNRIRRETLTDDISAVYDGQDRLVTYGRYTYTYTANGELRTETDAVSGDVTTYTYDARGNLVHVELPLGIVIDYVIDGFDRQAAKKRNGVLLKTWLYRDQLRIAAEVDAAGNVSRFVYGSRANLPDLMIRQGRTYRIVGNHLGSPRRVVDVASGAIASHFTQDAWGPPLGDSDTIDLPFGFAGGLYDEDTGLVRFGARDYDVQVESWTAKDPHVVRRRSDESLRVHQK